MLSKQHVSMYNGSNYKHGYDYVVNNYLQPAHILPTAPTD